MNITISYDLYIRCMAALLEQDVHEQVCGNSTPRWTEARRELRAAMLQAVTAEMDAIAEPQPSILHMRQAG